MSQAALLLGGFFLTIVGMLAFGFAPGVGRLLTGLGALLVWLTMALALERRMGSALLGRGLQALLGGAVMTVVATAVAADVAGIGLACAGGALLGLVAPEWSRWFGQRLFR
ncbi:MAG: hypothetical protein NZ533_10565 [Casimicrobiaceae bacterium]|nr:hypothetical protein [Casimicrobiaceae bacterium]MCX8097637.1 hypothetical protein [Casimicrobiaceae bacterium]MDW8311933.1 hypothetical protein [Burkholderiales bacterium]